VSGSPHALTSEELASRSGFSVRLIEQVLVEEVERGHVLRVGEEGWAPTPKLVAEFGRAFRDCERNEVATG
jgi:hypothetical protein